MFNERGQQEVGFIQRGTRQQYEALTVKDEDVLYILKNHGRREHSMFLGEIPVATVIPWRNCGGCEHCIDGRIYCPVCGGPGCPLCHTCTNCNHTGWITCPHCGGVCDGDHFLNCCGDWVRVPTGGGNAGPHHHDASCTVSGRFVVERMPNTGGNTRFLRGDGIYAEPPGVGPHANSNSALFGRSTSSLYGHSRAGTGIPTLAGEATPGADNGAFSREGHRHLSQFIFSPTRPPANMAQPHQIWVDTTDPNVNFPYRWNPTTQRWIPMFVRCNCEGGAPPIWIAWQWSLGRNRDGQPKRWGTNGKNWGATVNIGGQQ